MANKFSCQEKRQTYLIPVVGGFLGFLLGVSGIFNNLVFDQSERVLKNRLLNTSQEFTALSFTGFRTLFLTYVGMSAGLAVGDQLSSRNKSQQKN